VGCLKERLSWATRTKRIVNTAYFPGLRFGWKRSGCQMFANVSGSYETCIPGAVRFLPLSFVIRINGAKMSPTTPAGSSNFVSIVGAKIPWALGSSTEVGREILGTVYPNGYLQHVNGNTGVPRRWGMGKSVGGLRPM